MSGVSSVTWPQNAETGPAETGENGFRLKLRDFSFAQCIAHVTKGIRQVQSDPISTPETQRAFVHTADGSREAGQGLLRTKNPVIELPLGELFQ